MAGVRSSGRATAAPRASEIPQNPNRGPTRRRPAHVPTMDRKPTPFDPKDPSIPKVTLPPLRARDPTAIKQRHCG